MAKAKNNPEETDNEQDGMEQTKSAPGYLVFDKWELNVVSLARPEGSAKRFKLTCITKTRQTKLSQAEADSLNAQSHNSRVRYYPVGEKTGGDEEVIEII